MHAACGEAYALLLFLHVTCPLCSDGVLLCLLWQRLLVPCRLALLCLLPLPLCLVAFRRLLPLSCPLAWLYLLPFSRRLALLRQLPLPRRLALLRRLLPLRRISPSAVRPPLLVRCVLPCRLVLLRGPGTTGTARVRPTGSWPSSFPLPFSALPLVIR